MEITSAEYTLQFGILFSLNVIVEYIYWLKRVKKIPNLSGVFLINNYDGSVKLSEDQLNDNSSFY